MSENLIIMVLLIITVPLAGELKFYPFHDTFRVSFGIPVFFLLLLWAKKIPPVLCGIAAGISVVIFRITLEFIMKGNSALYNAFLLNSPSFFYYLVYSALFRITKVNNFHNYPQIIGLLSVFIEIMSGLVELSVRHFIFGNVFTLYILFEIIIIAVIRSFFTLSFFSIIKFNQAKALAEQQEKQTGRMLLLISSLYEESILLKKSIYNAEDITRNCYYLYQGIQDNIVSIKSQELAQEILEVAGQVHEIKKDNQRIYAGLSRMISNENYTDFMPMDEIGSIIVQTNQKYAHSVGKAIQFALDIDKDLPKLHVYTILSLINNLVSNSVESIEAEGKVTISVKKSGEWITFMVCDNGPGIPLKKRELIFKPGYTTKYNESGEPSTGMGLPYVKELVATLRGKVAIQNGRDSCETVFIIELPSDSLVQKG